MEFLTTVCIAAIASAMFRMLVPENKHKKQLSLLISGVFLLTAITSVSGAEIDLSAEYEPLPPQNNELSQQTIAELKRVVCERMSERINALLHENGIYPREIHIIVNISGLYSIEITQVELVFDESERVAAAAAAELLEAELRGEGINIRTILEDRGG